MPDSQRHDRYESPLITRYASAQMQEIFSPDRKFTTFHRLWIALARAEKEEGLPITDEQIAEMEAHVGDIDYEAAARYERELRHDVMAHIRAWGDICPKAKPIIHLGATSCYVGDNTDMILMRDGLALLRGRLLRVISNLAHFAERYKSLPCLAYTHLQPAQLTTVGKRATLWIYDLTLDLSDLDYVVDSLALLGSKGTTGTQASFAELFDGTPAERAEKVERVERRIAREMGFSRVVPVSGQTYSRKFDTRVLGVLAGIASSAYKFSGDLRILQSFKEMEEPFERGQVGSSAMPYKRNPMRCERIAALARYVLVDTLNPAVTAATQWFERTLDDSANKRLSVPEAFLAVDGILSLYANVTDGLVVYPKMINRRVAEELPFMASENILMDAVKRGGDRQDLHERLRVHAQAAGRVVKEEGGSNDLISRVAADPAFPLTEDDLTRRLDARDYVGLAPRQVETFLRDQVAPLLEGQTLPPTPPIAV